MTRPCFIVVDREHSGSISTRKLVIETAKLNVITAYSGAESLATLERFPRVDGLVIDAGITDMRCAELVEQLKSRHAEIPIIVIGTPSGEQCHNAHHYLEAFEPGKLLALLRELVPEANRIMEREVAELPTQS